MTGPFLTPDQTCDLLQLEGKFRVQVLLRRARAKKIPGAIKVSERVWRFRRDAIEQWRRS